MPTPDIHIAVSKKVRTSLADWSACSSGQTTPRVAALNLDDPSPKQIADLANEQPCYYPLGAIGPDSFFFLPDLRAICVARRRIPLANTLIGT